METNFECWHEYWRMTVKIKQWIGDGILKSGLFVGEIVKLEYHAQEINLIRECATCRKVLLQNLYNSLARLKPGFALVSESVTDRKQLWFAKLLFVFRSFAGRYDIEEELAFI